MGLFCCEFSVSGLFFSEGDLELGLIGGGGQAFVEIR